MKKRLWICLLVFGCMIPYPVYASDMQQSSTEEFLSRYNVWLYASYSDDVPAQKGDKFYIEYEDRAGMVYNLMADSSEAVKNPMEFELDEGYYVITHIAYAGYNAMVHEQGYCITTEFAAGEHAVNEIRLGIGKNCADTVYSEYRNSMYVRDNNVVNGLLTQEVINNGDNQGDLVEIQKPDETGQEDAINRPKIEDTSEDDTKTDDKEQDTSQDVQKKDSIWFSMLVRNIPVFVIFAALSAVCAIKHKRDKSEKTDW